MTAGAPRTSSTAGSGPSRRGYLALALQEALTAAARVRANRQVAADAGAFRAHLKQLLASVDADSRRAGYSGEDVKYALYAYIAFLDESVLNSTQPMFAEWHRRPLQEEVFGGHVGGELFFQQLRELLTRQDSEDLADVLEVFQLSLLLGFRGRYRAGDQGELLGFTRATGERIERIRGGYGPLAPAGTPQAGEAAPKSRDPWLRRLGTMAAVSLGIVVLLFVLFQLWLGKGVAAVRAAAGAPPG